MNAVLRYVERNAFGLALALVALALHLVGAPSLQAEVVGVMAVGSTTDTFELNSAMKVLFEDSIVNNVVTDSELIDLFEKSTDIKQETTGGGRYIETAQMFGLNAGYGHRGERDYIPVPNGPMIKNGRIGLKKALGSVEMTADVFEKVTQGKEAFVDWSKRAIPSLVQRMTNEKDRIMLGFGAGIKAKVAGIDASNPERVRIQLSDAYGIAGYTQAWLGFLEMESVVFAPNPDGTGMRSFGNQQSGIVVDIDDNEDAIFLSRLPAGVEVGDFIFLGDDSGVSAQDAGGEDREFMGLLGHVDDGGILSDYLGISRAQFRQWRGIVMDGSGAPHNGLFTDSLIVRGDQQVRTKGGGKIDVIIAPEIGAINFWEDLKKDRAINDPKSFTGGKGQLRMILGDRTVEIRAARKLPPQVAFGLTRGVFKRYTLGKFEWDTRTGSMWRQVTDARGRLDAFYAYGREYEQYACSHPRKNIRWEGLAG